MSEWDDVKSGVEKVNEILSKMEIVVRGKQSTQLISSTEDIRRAINLLGMNENEFNSRPLLVCTENPLEYLKIQRRVFSTWMFKPNDSEAVTGLFFVDVTGCKAVLIEGENLNNTDNTVIRARMFNVENHRILWDQ